MIKDDKSHTNGQKGPQNMTPVYLHLIHMTYWDIFLSGTAFRPKTGDHDQTLRCALGQSFKESTKNSLKSGSTGCSTWILIGVDDDSTARVFTFAVHSSSSAQGLKCHKRHASRQLESQAHHKGQDEDNDQQRFWCLRRAHQ